MPWTFNPVTRVRLPAGKLNNVIMKRYFKFTNSIVEIKPKESCDIFDAIEYTLYPTPQTVSMNYTTHFIDMFKDLEITEKEFYKWKKEFDFLDMRMQQFTSQVREFLKEIGFHS